MAVINTESQSGKVTLNALRVLMAEKFESLGELQKKALEYLALFLALTIVYSLYLKSSLDRTICPAGPEIVPIDLTLMLAALKFFLITGDVTSLFRAT